MFILALSPWTSSAAKLNFVIMATRINPVDVALGGILLPSMT